MMHFKEFLMEGTNRSKTLSEKEFISKLKNGYLENFKKMLFTEKYIYRGVSNIPSAFAFTQPSKFNRVSANTSNYYTLVTDMLTNWDGIPRRSLSLICSTRYATASDYGDVYVVIPQDKHLIGYGTDPDFWYNFNHLTDFMEGGRSLTQFNNVVILDLVYRYFEFFNIPWSENFTHVKFYDRIVKLTDKIQAYVKKNNITYKEFATADCEILENEFDFVAATSVVKQKLVDLLVYKEFDFWEVFSYLFDPKLNDIRTTTNISTITQHDDIEVWTDADSLLIHSQFVDDNYKRLVAIVKDIENGK